MYESIKLLFSQVFCQITFIYLKLQFLLNLTTLDFFVIIIIESQSDVPSINSSSTSNSLKVLFLIDCQEIIGQYREVFDNTYIFLFNSIILTGSTKSHLNIKLFEFDSNISI